MNVLVVNAGSSSLKLALLDERDNVLAAREIEHGTVVGPLGKTDAVGHRIVHGGERFREAVRIDAEVEQRLRELTDLAPLHQRKSLDALDAVTAALPGTPAVACFDTAFHATLPPSARTYALPAEWRERWGLRRYGFHGLSHAWVARRAPELLGVDGKGLRIVSCHLGAGASLCAIRDGRSLDTTMGFTPLEGLVMATRSGSVDPGLLLWLLEHEQLSAGELAEALEHRSGLLGLAGSADMREIVARASGDDRSESAPAARLALEVYVHRLRAGISAMAAALGGLDVLVFTGGVGEHSAEVRAKAAAGLAFLGVELDDEHNSEAHANGEARADGQGGADREIGTGGARVRTLVLTAREDIEIARQVRSLLAR